MLGWNIEPVSPECTDTSRNYRTGLIQVAGACEGAVVCIMPNDLVRRVAALMFDTDPEKLTLGLLHDALGEITNMIGGNLKALLPGPSFLSLPVVIEGSDYTLCVPAAKPVVEAAFVSQDEPVAVKLLVGGRQSRAKPDAENGKLAVET